MDVFLGSDEVLLIGSWVQSETDVRGDDVYSRIKELTSRHLVRLASDCTGWETLYRDPWDGRYWELTYPQGHLHGGGPPMLSIIVQDLAREKYQLD
jgi:hypothetical protein